MSDFVGDIWGYYIAIVALAGIVWCAWLLLSQRYAAGKGPAQDADADTGHVWDEDLRELNNPLPRWWMWMFLLACAFSVGYLILYPGLGAYQGLLHYSSQKAVAEQQAEAARATRPLYARFMAMDIAQAAHDAQARDIGQRLFANYCAQCHGVDAGGSKGFPSLADGDWLYGGTPQAITQSIARGRTGIMPPFKGQLNEKSAADVAQYVRSLSGLASDPVRAIRGKPLFESRCAACHGAAGTGNQALGAPNLTDRTWLYGSSEQVIVETILNGRQNSMPAHEAVLTPEQIHLLTAYVWGLSNAGGQ